VIALAGPALKAVREVLEAALPLLGLIAFFQFVVLRRAPEGLGRIAIGVGMALVGFYLFIFGVMVSLIPMGIAIGESLSGAPTALVVGLALVLGAAVASAEPAVRIFAYEVDSVSAGAIRKRLVVATIALGVGIAVALAVLRIEHAWSLAVILVPGYLLALVLAAVAPRRFVPVAFDAGAVATGPVAVNFILPLTTGLAVGVWGDGAGLVGFGVVGLVALVPIIGMLVLGIVLNRGRADV
jgi:hypothetical protein